MDTVKRIYTFRTISESEALGIRDGLHYQLKGNDDYIRSNIVLNDNGMQRENGMFIVRVYIFDECSEIPLLTLDI